MPSDRRPVAFVTTEEWNGSYPRVARWLIKGFEEIGHPYDAVFLEGRRGVNTVGNARVVHLGRRRARWSLPAIAAYLRHDHPKAAFIKPPSLAITCLAAGKLTGGNVIPWEPSFKRWETDTGPTHRTAYFRARTWAYASAPALAAVTTDVADALRDEFGPRLRTPVTVIPNPVDIDDVRARSEGGAPREHAFELCAVGRLAHEKGYDVLLRALALASPRLGEDWHLKVLGKGPRLEQLLELRAELGLQERVEFVGWVDNPYPTMAASDVFVHPARFEPFGIVYTEALALGIPIVATACPGGPIDVLDHGEFGRLVPTGEPAALADAIVEISEDGELRRTLAERGPGRAGAYAPAAIARQMVSLADKVASHAPDLDAPEGSVAR